MESVESMSDIRRAVAAKKHYDDGFREGVWEGLALGLSMVFVAILAMGLLAGCRSVEVPVVPAPPAGPVAPIEQPPAPPPVEAPASVAEFVGKIALGRTLAEAETAVGARASSVPGTPPSARWFVNDPAGKWMVNVVLEAGRIARKGWAQIGSNP